MSFYRFLSQKFNSPLISDQAVSLLRLLAADRVQRVLAAIAEAPGTSASALHDATGIKQADLSRLLRRLADAGMIRAERSARSGAAGRPPMTWHPAQSPGWEALERAEAAVSAS